MKSKWKPDADDSLDIMRQKFPFLLFVLFCAMIVMSSYYGDQEHASHFSFLAGSMFTLLVLCFFHSPPNIRYLPREFEPVSQYDWRMERNEPISKVVFETAREGIMITDPEGNILAVNPAFMQLTGYGADDVIGKKPSVLKSGKHDSEFYARMWRSLTTTGNWQGEIWNKRKSGECYLEHLEINAVKNSRGQIVYYVGIFSDVTENRRAEEQYRQAMKVFENTAEGIIITDAEGKILSVNPAFVETTGYSPEEVIGQNPRILQSGKQGLEFYKKMWKELLETGKWQGEIWNRRKNGELYVEWLNINAVRNELGEVTNYVAVFTDITARKQQEERLKYLAHYDVLTGLPNRFLFYDRLNQGLAQAERHQHLLAVMFLDLDRFKYINDTLGHDFGDLVLIDVATRLKSCLRSEDTVARLGGDEFTIILPNINSEQDAARVAQKIIDMISKPFSVQGHELFVTPSIGISLFPCDGVLADTLLKCADMAMYRAKERGNQFQFYTSEMNHSTAQRFSMEGSLRKALENQEFFLQYQPRFDLHTGRVAGVEALLRWENPELGVVSPAEFISLAEETGLIVPIGYWVLKEACLQKKRWQQSGYGSLSISVNVSPCQLQQADFAERVSDILQETGVEPQGLELEITENLFVQDDEHYMDVLNKLLALGLHISIDDFGTGYSSLQYLKRLRVHCLKIDRSFIQGLPVDAGNAAITSAIVKLAHDLNMRIVAEGVESEQELQFLSKVGCDEIQGFYFCPPISVEALEPILHQYSPC